MSFMPVAGQLLVSDVAKHVRVIEHMLDVQQRADDTIEIEAT